MRVGVGGGGDCQPERTGNRKRKSLGNWQKPKKNVGRKRKGIC